MSIKSDEILTSKYFDVNWFILGTVVNCWEFILRTKSKRLQGKKSRKDKIFLIARS